jgi:signal transduction histidine kinase/CheY-like chemotaxis protein
MRAAEPEQTSRQSPLHLPTWARHGPGVLALAVGTIAVASYLAASVSSSFVRAHEHVASGALALAGASLLFGVVRRLRDASVDRSLRPALVAFGVCALPMTLAALALNAAPFVGASWSRFVPAVTTVAGILSLALLSFALFRLPKVQLGRSGWIAAGLDLATVLLTGSLGFWLHALSPSLRSTPLSAAPLALVLGTASLSLLALAALVLVFFRRHGTLRCAFLAPVAAGVVLLLAAEVLPTCHALGIGLASDAAPRPVGWILALLAFSIGIHHSATTVAATSCGTGRNTLVAVPFAATGLVGLLLATAVVSRETWIENISVLLPAVFAALVLIVVRQTRIAQENLAMAGEMQAAKELAETANSSRLQFLANISHDLRTPLNGILGCAQILLRDKALTKKQRELVSTSQSCAEHLRTLINDLLDLSKLESGKLELAPVAFDLHAFLEELLGGFRLSAETKNIILETDRQPDLPQWITADRRRLHQILGNLLHNAIKFTNRGAVTLRVTLDAGTLFFAVKDTGCGIMPDKIDDLFKPFHVADQKSIQLEGTGLGLSIAKKLVERMGGDIVVSSTYGRGSVFTASIPLEESAPVVEIQRTIVDYQGHRRRILIVDDTAQNRVVLRSILEPLDFLVMEASSGAEALKQLEFAKPDVLVLDLMMPEMDGFELCRRVRALNLPTAPVCLALSAMAGEDVLDRCKAAGFADWVRKPVNVELLLESLHNHAGIEWVYGLIKPGPKESVSVTPTSRRVAPPPPDILASLTATARRGNVLQFEKQLDQAIETDPALTPFGDAARRYLDELKVRELADWLDTLQQKKAV